MAGYDVYRNGLRGAVRGLWNGAIDKDQFVSRMKTHISSRLRQAWVEGAAQCNVTEDDMTEDEWKTLSDIVKDELGYLSGYADDIVKHNKKNGGKIAPYFVRAEMWANRYPDIVDRAKVKACGDKKLIWIYGDTEHCNDCLRYNGRVYRASTWAKYDIRPKNPSLECHGFNCHCRLDITTRPVNKGKPPAMTGG